MKCPGNEPQQALGAEGRQAGGGAGEELWTDKDGAFLKTLKLMTSRPSSHLFEVN